MSPSAEARFAALDLLAEAANRLDQDDLEGWAECFGEESTYAILSRENVDRRLPLPLFQCENKQMIRDRVLSLRKANVTNPHRDRHVVGPARMTAADNDDILAEAGFALYQTNLEGVSRLFSVGLYRDRIRVADGVAHFVDRTVIVDMFSIPTMLSTPI